MIFRTKAQGAAQARLRFVDGKAVNS